MHLNTIEIVRQWSEKGLPLRRVYRKLRDRELFLHAYGKIYANKGATTPGIDPTDIVDGMSLARIDKTIDQLEQGEYEWQPVRRAYRIKKNGKRRPLGLPPWSDKLLQEVIRQILEAYYEPKFSPYSHGYRPKRGCHTALEQIQKKWKGVKWFIKADIKGCFNNLDHNLILNLIGTDMPDQRFLKLLKDMLKAGYMEDWQYHQTYSGVPQGGIASPILSNIILNELDKYIEHTLIPQYTQGQKRQSNPIYNQISNQRAKAKATGDVLTYRALTKQMRQTPSVKPDDDQFRRLYYCRYADDLLLGFAGPKAEATEIQQKITVFLRNLNITTSSEKSLINHADSEFTRFLGYDLSAKRSNTKLSQEKNGRCKKRSINSGIKLYVPREVTKEQEVRYTQRGKPIHIKELTHYSDYEIVMRYNSEFQGLVNYYALAQNVSTRLQPLKYVCMQSLVKTLAHKHQRKVKWVYGKYKTRFDTGVTGLMVTVPREQGQNPLVAKFGALPIRRLKTTILKDEMSIPYFGRNELTQRLLAQECELCGSHEHIEVHHLRKLADIKRKYQGRKQPPQWAVKMMERNRKTLVVCRQCHQKIHNGQYDGPKLTYDQLES
jgi:group II intron reverse transcriptase/maturase